MNGRIFWPHPQSNIPKKSKKTVARDRALFSSQKAGLFVNGIAKPGPLDPVFVSEKKEPGIPAARTPG